MIFLPKKLNFELFLKFKKKFEKCFHAVPSPFRDNCVCVKSQDRGYDIQDNYSISSAWLIRPTSHLVGTEKNEQ